jgi:hypothetical protein
MTKHTPGPWKVFGPKQVVDKDSITMDCAIEYGDGGPGTIIAECFGRSGEKNFHDSLANARLMASAPELLIACEGALSALLLSPHVDKQQAIDYLIEVISIAKGESHD